jgi:hypothetical protein
MSHTHGMDFDACQDEVEGMMKVGESFGSVEATIETAKLTEDEQAALWLLAWSMRNGTAHAHDGRATPAGLLVIGD